MVDAGTVGKASTEIEKLLNDYKSYMSGLSGSWSGHSYDSTIKQAEAFFGEYQAIIGQLNSYKAAVENYKKYEEVKGKKQEYEQQLANAKEEDKGILNSNISAAEENMNELKSAIESDLSSASSPKLTATSNANSTLSGTTMSVGGVTYKKARYNGTTVWYAIIPKNKQPQLAVAHDNYDYSTTEPTSDIAKRKNAKLAINFGLTGEPAGMIYTDGKLVSDTGNRRDETLIMTQDGTLEAVKNSEYSTQDILDMNPVWATKGFYTIARDGEYVDENTIDPSLAADKHPRTFIGQDYEGNYIVGVCDGRGELTGLPEEGLTLREVYDFVNTEVTDDLRFLFNGDGGGSSAFVYDGEKLNSNAGDPEERDRPDAIYWT